MSAAAVREGASGTEGTPSVSAPSAPSGWRAMQVYRRMMTTRLRRGRLRWAVLAFVALPVLGTAALALGGKWGRDLFDNILQVHLRLLVLLVPALATSSVVAQEIDSRTFTFIFARPAPRWAMPLGKYLASVLPLALLFALSVAASFVIALLVPPAGPRELVENLPTLGRSVAAVMLGVFTFGAMAMVLGSWFTRHPFVVVLVYLFVVEGIIASLPFIINVVGMSRHLRNVAGVTVAQQWDSMFAELTFSPWISVGVLGGMTLVSIVLACLSVSGAEYRTDR